MSYICENIGERLRRKRLDVGYTQEHLAELADLHPTYIGQVERGEKNITIESLEKYVLHWIILWMNYFLIFTP